MMSFTEETPDPGVDGGRHRLCGAPTAHGLVRVMVVDDDSIFLTAVKRMLRAVPCSLHLFDEPERALAQFPGTAPELLLVDLHMPRMDGLEFLHGVRPAFDAALAPDVYLQSAGRTSPDVTAAAESLDAEIVDKAVVLDRVWLAGLIERHREGCEVLAGASAG